MVDVFEEERSCNGEKDTVEVVELRHGRAKIGALKVPEWRMYSEWRVGGVEGAGGVPGEKGEVTSSGL